MTTCARPPPTTHHAEVVRVQYDPREFTYQDLRIVFWARHGPTTLNRPDPHNLAELRLMGEDVGTQYTAEQEKLARGGPLKSSSKCWPGRLSQKSSPQRNFMELRSTIGSTSRKAGEMD